MNDFVKEVIISKINFETGFKYSIKETLLAYKNGNIYQYKNIE